jgi:hypothetical protein
MDAKFYKNALFNGMTGNAFKLGTVLSLGWFWMRVAGCHNVYRGQDGNFDYDRIQAVLSLGDSDVTIAGQDLPADTIWHFIRRQASGCGLESPDSDPCIVLIDSAGDMYGDVPNAPLQLDIEAIAGGKFTLRWRYTAISQQVAPTGFRIYMDSGSGFDFASPVATVTNPLGGPGEFEWTSGALTHGQPYRFCVRSWREDLGAELVINGEFNNTKYWTWDPQGVWTLSDRKARFAEGGGFTFGDLIQEITVAAGKPYRVTFTVVAVSGADVCPKIGNTWGTTRTAAGTYTEDIVAANTDGLTLYGDSGGGGSGWLEVDDVSVKEVLTVDVETRNTAYVAAVADSQGPTALTGLKGGWSQI